MNLESSLKRIVKNLNYNLINGEIGDAKINKVVYDSRKVEDNDLFICLNGARFDSHTKINDVINKGAKVIVVEENNENVKSIDFKNCIVLEVTDTRIALAVISNNYFGNPQDKLKIIGVTGTKGKTTTSFMIKSIIENAGYKVGLIGTVGIYFGDEHIYTDNTTPESYILHEYFAKMIDKNITHVVMEVSSQSLKYHRVYGINFEYAVWTNIEVEHIGENEHTDYEDYLTSKLKIFSMAKNAIINSFTKNYDEVISECKKNNVIIYEKKDNKMFNLQLPGSYNQENASLAYEVGKAMGIKEEVINTALEKVIVPGRCELVYKDDEIKVIVDFSYENNGAIKFLNTIKEQNPKRIVTVFGCGGNRSKDRRYGMGEVTGKLADFVILTADNSRYEKTLDIIADIETVLSKYKKKDDLENGYIILEDRREAIEYAIKNHKVGDVICVMGKGHEPMMEMNGEKVRFLDREVILDIISNRAKK
ncbi:MAG: UDP-N-acetylmuramoyl-L-alanyl-D-glutamate--2,6-diaminopimelate ligase [Lachnospiraceae bacterium]|nr:UDP-N-acetylmuramoyl-L-alanyl-D-glutamate--2,6-diaminopimelate ligase [Lachnospiraceae bacterium]